jgi:hypothetical protein
MDWKKLLFAAPLLALSFAPEAEARDHSRRHENWKRQSEQSYRYRYNNNYDSRYRYQGQDRNRDGAINRYEWRGNNRSFERLDRNRDGLITPRDRYRYNGDRYRYDNDRNRYYYYGR